MQLRQQGGKQKDARHTRLQRQLYHLLLLGQYIRSARKLPSEVAESTMQIASIRDFDFQGRAASRARL